MLHDSSIIKCLGEEATHLTVGDQRGGMDASGQGRVEVGFSSFACGRLSSAWTVYVTISCDAHISPESGHGRSSGLHFTVGRNSLKGTCLSSHHTTV